MSNEVIRQEMEARLTALAPTFPTQFQNSGGKFTPPTDAPYQRVTMLFARPDNPTQGGDHYRQLGYMQVDLIYPQGLGAGSAEVKGDAIRNWFTDWTGYSTNEVELRILRTPEVGTGVDEGSRFILPVRIYFQADIFKQS